MNRPATHSFAISAAPARGLIVRNPWARDLLTFFMVLGPLLDLRGSLMLMMLLALYHAFGLAGVLGKV